MGSQQLHHRLKAKPRRRQACSHPGRATVEQLAGSRRHLARCFRGCFRACGETVDAAGALCVYTMGAANDKRHPLPGCPPSRRKLSVRLQPAASATSASARLPLRPGGIASAAAKSVAGRSRARATHIHHCAPLRTEWAPGRGRAFYLCAGAAPWPMIHRETGEREASNAVRALVQLRCSLPLMCRRACPIRQHRIVRRLPPGAHAYGGRPWPHPVARRMPPRHGHASAALAAPDAGRS